jgi:hypothetical protein
LEWEKLTALYTLCQEDRAMFYQSKATAPTKASVQTVNEALKIALPPSFIRFAEECPLYGIWFAGIGEDYESQMHILELNKVFHAPEETAGHAQAEALPSYLIMINHGHDGDCDCLDTRHFHESTKEYRIQYWNAQSDVHLPPFETFQEYIESHVQHWMKNLQGKARRRARALMEE